MDQVEAEIANRNAAMVLKEDVLNDEFDLKFFNSRENKFITNENVLNEEDIRNLIDYSKSHPLENYCRYAHLSPGLKFKKN